MPAFNESKYHEGLTLTSNKQQLQTKVFINLKVTDKDKPSKFSAAG